MSIARHHAEWLSLVEVSGPFLSMPVLLKVFPQGLDAHDPDHLRSLRLAYEEWEDRQDDTALHRAWVRFVLTKTLELPDAVLAEGQPVPQTLNVPGGLPRVVSFPWTPREFICHFRNRAPGRP